jgi:PAS domain S-box-containing protein
MLRLRPPKAVPGPGPAITLDPAEFSRAFPFHVACDGKLRVVQAGPSLGRIAPEVLPGTGLADSFDLARPNRRLTLADIEARLGTLMLLEHRPSAVLFRGQFVAAPDSGYVFLGAPWFTSAEALEAVGLSLVDFAPQDSIAELLLISQTQQIAISNLSQMNSQLTQQRETLRRTESLYQSAIAASYGVAYQESFADDGFVYVGEGFEELTRFKPGELRPSQLRALEQRTQDYSELTGQTSVLRSGEAALRRRSDYAFVRGDGKTRWISDSSVLVTDANGRPTGAIGIFFDITFRKDDEARLRASEEEARRLAIVAARTSSAVIILDAERRAIWCNDALSRMTGFKKEEFLGRQVRDVIDLPAVDPAVARASNNAMVAGSEFHSETRLRRADGKIIWVAAEVQTLHDRSLDLSSSARTSTPSRSTSSGSARSARSLRRSSA